MITYGLIGAKLGHSFSPMIHKRMCGYEYTLKELDEKQLVDFLEKKEFKGVNVTVPYKETVMKHCHIIDPLAQQIGAVNVVINRGGTLVGYNTDWYGMTHAVQSLTPHLTGKIVAILGTGGTSKTACYVAQKLGATTIYQVSRTPRGDQISYEDLYTLPHVDMVINTTPVGMHPNCMQCPIDIRRVKKVTYVLDVIYNPMRTKLILDCIDHGIACTNGLSMLVAQAKMAGELFLKKKFPDSLILSTTAYMRIKNTNVVLIGMPGSGKTRIGMLVASFTNKKVVDTDKLVIANAGMKIPLIFEQYGEIKFREYEFQAIHSIYQQKNLVISTGGGSIKLKGNMDKLRQNGVVVYLRCETQKLSKKGRPLSQCGDIDELFHSRKPFYEKYADFTIDNVDTVAKCAEKIKKGYYEYSNH